jgi:hypothetical protein
MVRVVTPAALASRSGDQPTAARALAHSSADGVTGCRKRRRGAV